MQIGIGRTILKDWQIQARKMEDHFVGLENGGPENAGLDSEGPFRRSNGIVCSEVV